MLIDGMERERKMKYTAKKLESMKTLCVSQADDLEVETRNKRVWLSRVVKNLITVENLIDGRWVIVEEYQG